MKSKLMLAILFLAQTASAASIFEKLQARYSEIKDAAAVKSAVTAGGESLQIRNVYLSANTLINENFEFKSNMIMFSAFNPRTRTETWYVSPPGTNDFTPVSDLYYIKSNSGTSLKDISGTVEVSKNGIKYKAPVGFYATADSVRFTANEKQIELQRALPSYENEFKSHMGMTSDPLDGLSVKSGIEIDGDIFITASHQSRAADFRDLVFKYDSETQSLKPTLYRFIALRRGSHLQLGNSTKYYIDTTSGRNDITDMKGNKVSGRILAKDEINTYVRKVPTDLSGLPSLAVEKRLLEPNFYIKAGNSTLFIKVGQIGNEEDPRQNMRNIMFGDTVLVAEFEVVEISAEGIVSSYKLKGDAAYLSNGLFYDVKDNNGKTLVRVKKDSMGHQDQIIGTSLGKNVIVGQMHDRNFSQVVHQAKLAETHLRRNAAPKICVKAL
ncbi:MAG: hypothetical protein V4736_14985 [Bdellovibrionota bacterium]